MNRSLGLVATLLAVAVGCGGDDESSSGHGDVVVFAAASLTDAFTELGAAFTDDHPDTTISFNFAASSELAAQLNEGAPGDVFASADVVNMDKLIDAGNTASDPVVFATNSAELIVAPGNPLGIAGVADLAGGVAADELIIVTCAPEVPCGAYASEVFDLAGIEVTPDSYEENVKAVVTKVVIGEADVGIAYATDIIAAGDDADGVEIPAEINVEADYPIAITSEASNADGAQQFIDFVTGADGQAILETYGFGPP